MAIIKTISFSNLINWSVQYLVDRGFSYNEDYKLISIGDFLKRNKTAIEIQDNEEYKRVTIKVRNGGVFLRDRIKGLTIGTKNQFLVKEGQFLLSKIDARNGAFGVVPKEVDGAIITGNFWTFDVDYNMINPIFLSLIVTTQEFIHFCENASNGTTNRHYLQEEIFLAQKIPLPTLTIQNRIVSNYNTKLALAQQQTGLSLQLEKDISSYIDNTLGINIKKVEYKKEGVFLRLVRFKDFHKWGVDAQSNTIINYQKDYSIFKISKICNVSSGGTPSRAKPEYYKGTIPWIKTGEVLNDVIYDSEEKITEEAIRNSSAKLYEKGSLIIAMYGQGKTRGRTAKLGVNATTNQACAVLSNINNSIILTDYLWLYLGNEYDRLRELASGNNQPNLNAQMIKDYPVVVPPIPTQQQIINDVFSLRNKLKALKVESLKNINDTIKEFEQEIFSN